MEAHQHLLAQVVVVTQRTPTPAYNTVAVSRDHASLQQGGQLASPHWLTMPRPVHLSVPPRCCCRLYRPSLAAWSTSTHRAAFFWMSCLLSMSESLLGKPGFFSNKLEANYYILSTVVCTDGSMDMHTNCSHYSLVNFK